MTITIVDQIRWKYTRFVNPKKFEVEYGQNLLTEKPEIRFFTETTDSPITSYVVNQDNFVKILAFIQSVMTVEFDHFNKYLEIYIDKDFLEFKYELASEVKLIKKSDDSSKVYKDTVIDKSVRVLKVPLTEK